MYKMKSIGLNRYTLTDEDLEVLRLFRGEAA